MPDPTDPAAAIAGDQHPGQQPYRGPCTEAGRCLIHRDCPLFGPCAKARAGTDGPVYTLSADGMTLEIRWRVPGGVKIATVRRQRDAGPFTDADIAAAIDLATAAAGRQMEPGQRNTARRAVTRFGTVWTHVMHGPPTWWLPKLRHEKDGTFMAGWLRLAVAVKVDPGRKGKQR